MKSEFLAQNPYVTIVIKRCFYCYLIYVILFLLCYLIIIIIIKLLYVNSNNNFNNLYICFIIFRQTSDKLKDKQMFCKNRKILEYLPAVSIELLNEDYCIVKYKIVRYNFVKMLILKKYLSDTIFR